MKCSGCGADIFEGISRCPFCKTPTSPIKDDKFKNFDFTYTITSKDQIKAIRDTATSVSEKKPLFSLSKNPSKKRRQRRKSFSGRKRLRFGKINRKKLRGYLILGIALICVIAIIWGAVSLISSLFKKDEVIPSYSYVKDNALYLLYKGETVDLTNQAISKDYLRHAETDETLLSVTDILRTTKLTHTSEDGTVTYFFENYNPEKNSGTLKVIRKGKEKSIKTISKNAHNSIIINKNGTSILFIQDADENGDMGVLHYWKQGMDAPHELSSDIDHGTFAFSADGNEALYIQNLDRSVMQGDLYSKNLKNLKKEKIKIDNDVCYIFGTDNTNKSYIYAKGFDPSNRSFEIYTCEMKADAEKIRLGERTKLAPHMLKTKNYLFVYGMNEDGTHNLYYVNIKNGDKEKISSGVNTITQISEDEKYVMYNKVYNDTTADYYVYTSGKQPQKVAENVNINFADVSRSPQLAASKDLKTFVYISGFDARTGSGKLFISKFKPGKEAEPEHISDDVHSCYMTAEGKIIYTKDYSVNRKVFDVYAYNKKSSEIIKDELTSDMFEVSKKGNTIFYTTGFNTDKKVGDFKTSDLKGNSDMISGDVFAFDQTELGDIFFYKNFDKESGKFDLYYMPNNTTDSELVEKGIDVLMCY